MIKPLILNEILHKKNYEEQNKYLQKKLTKVKSLVNISCPKCYSNFLSRNPNVSYNIRLKKLSKNNLSDKGRNTKNNCLEVRKYPSESSYYDKYDNLSYNKKRALLKIAIENIKLYKRLNEKKPVYNLNNFLRDYDKSQYYKSNHCKFPSIDFYKSGKCPIEISLFNFCSFKNYDNINKKIKKFSCKTIDIKNNNRSNSIKNIKFRKLKNVPKYQF